MTTSLNPASNQSQVVSSPNVQQAQMGNVHINKPSLNPHQLHQVEGVDVRIENVKATTFEAAKPQPIMVEALPNELVPVEGVQIKGGTRGALVGVSTGVLNTATLTPIDRFNNLRVAEGKKMPISHLFGPGMFRGAKVGLAGSITNFTTLFVVQQKGRDLSDNALSNHPDLANTMSGGLSGVAQAVVGRPFSNVVLKMQTVKEKVNLVTIIREIPSGQFIQTMYKGLNATIIRNTTYAGVYFPTYDCIKRSMQGESRDQNHQQDTAQQLRQGGGAGALSGIAGTAVSLPFQNASVVQANSSTKLSTAGALKVMFQRGWSMPWQTFGMTSLRMGISSALAGVATEGVNIACKYHHDYKTAQQSSQRDATALHASQLTILQPDSYRDSIAEGYTC